MGGGVQGLNPVRGRQTCLEQERAEDVVGGTNDPFSSTILRRSVGAGHAQVCAAGEEEGPGVGVIKLAPVVALHSFDSGTELCSHIREEISESVIRVGLET